MADNLTTDSEVLPDVVRAAQSTYPFISGPYFDLNYMDWTKVSDEMKSFQQSSCPHKLYQNQYPHLDCVFHQQMDNQQCWVAQNQYVNEANYDQVMYFFLGAAVCKPTFKCIHPLSGVSPLFTHGTLEDTC